MASHRVVGGFGNKSCLQAHDAFFKEIDQPNPFSGQPARFASGNNGLPVVLAPSQIDPVRKDHPAARVLARVAVKHLQVIRRTEIVRILNGNPQRSHVPHAQVARRRRPPVFLKDIPYPISVMA